VIADTVLKNAKAYINRQIVDCSIAVEEGKIIKIGKETQMPQADQKTDLKNLLVLPGLIDAHVHLRDEGKAYKEDFYSGTSAAAAGGFTTVLDMPNNDPVTMNTQTLRNRMQIAQRRTIVNVGFYSEFPKENRELTNIVAQGAVGFKFFMGNQIGGLNIDDDAAVAEAFAEVAKLKLPVAVHAEDKTLLAANEGKLRLAKKDTQAAFLSAHSEEVERKAIERLLKITQKTSPHIHFCHVTSKEGLEAVAEAKKSGRTVTCEATPNHLLLNSADVPRLGQILIVAPPIRSQNHQDALWKGIANGEIDTLGSDHAPHTLEEKMAGSIWDVKPGTPGLETTLALIFTQINKNKLSLQRAVELLAEKPAEIFGLKGQGKLESGAEANLTVVDYKRTWKIDASKFKSKAKFSPFNGWEVQGKAVKTYVGGNLAMEDGEIVAKAGSGRILSGDNQ
jgi:dihydroorotase (multifunctional complex type)